MFYAVNFMFVCLDVYVLLPGPQSVLTDIQDHALAKVARALPSMVIQNKASSTTKKYLGVFKDRGHVHLPIRSQKMRFS